MTLLHILNSYHRLPDKVRKTLETVVLSVVVLLALLWVVAAVTFGRYYVATFVAGLSLTLAVTCYVLAKGRSVRHQVGALLGIYIGLIGFFGSVHYILFLRNPDLYAFSEVFKEGKALEVEALRAESETHLAKVRAQIEGRPEWNILDFVHYSTEFSKLAPFSSLNFGKRTHILHG